MEDENPYPNNEMAIICGADGFDDFKNKMM